MSVASPPQIAFRCNHCWQTTVAGADCSGQNVACISCQQPVVVPQPTAEGLERASAMNVPQQPAAPATSFVNANISDADLYQMARKQARSGASPSSLACSRMRRFSAAIIDAFCLGMLAVTGVLLGNAMFPSTTDEPSSEAGMLMFGLVGMLVVFHWMLTATHGQTIGKMLMNIKVVNGQGEAPGFLQGVVLRYWLTGLLGMIPFFSLFDSITIFFNDDKRCIHDYLAGTYVIEAS